MKFTVEFETDEYRNLKRVEFVVNENVTLTELIDEVIRPMLTSIGYCDELIKEALGDISEVE